MTVETNLTEFNQALEAYGRHARLTAADVVARKGADLGFRLYKKLRELTPEKGTIRSERLAALASGGGIKVRPEAVAYAKKKTISTATNIKTRQSFRFFEVGRTGKVKSGGLSFWQLAVKRELNIRESGRGYLGYSARFKSFAAELKANKFDAYRQQLIRDRYLRFISAVGFKSDPDSVSLTFKWGGNNKASDGLAVAMQKPRARSKIAEALAEARADMMVYIQRKMSENRTA